MKAFRLYSCVFLFVVIVAVLVGPVESQTGGSFVALQGTSPGIAQAGNTNVSGIARAGTFSGSGAGLTGIPWSAITGSPISYPPNGTAGGDLTGTYPNPGLATLASSLSKVSGGVMTCTGTRIGIGTSNPGAKLHLANDANSVTIFMGDLQPFGSAGIESNFSASATHLWFAENSNRVASVTGGGIAYFKHSITTDGNTNFFKGWLGNSGGSSGAGQLFNVNNNAYVTFTQISGTGGVAGGIAVGDDGSIQRALMYSNGTQGFVQANVKNFREPNELNPDTDIVYASIEGPEAAAYVRGTARLVNGSAVIDLPDHFRVSCLADGMTVQLTPQSTDSKGLAVIQKGLDGIQVGELQNGSGSYEFDWEVKAIRKGYKNYRPVRAWDEDRLEVAKSREKQYRQRQKDNTRFFHERSARDYSPK